MHEMSLLDALMTRIAGIAREEGARRITAVQVRLGALAHLSREHFLEHFVIAARGTVAEGARVEARLMTDPHDPDAQGVVLESVEIEA